ncbi:protein HEADING DATE REPRESSOR 1-like [Zingiber officinale]|uniref:Protein HEADING DATE REPRESSOR 1 n=1 Tax=Zingiber officinale TaxID=94328 RepID=A0A8J5LJU7_ZINOF|nr:protein HEADING DATE REPRESSOR 1-like [Zingiber officinale]KAG6520558.1 hypothetical protein ZIOFF_017615 [Zingiber officinale]
MEGFSASSPPRIFWNSRKRSATPRSLENKLMEESLKPAGDGAKTATTAGGQRDDEDVATAKAAALTERRRSLFEPLESTGSNGRRTPAELLLPPPDFEAASYPKGWLVGKKRKLVNVDVVESMRRVAVQEMNRKDKEIDGLNEQLEEDARCLEHLQVQLLDERSKRSDAERQNAMLRDQISMLMTMLEENQAEEIEEEEQQQRHTLGDH